MKKVTVALVYVLIFASTAWAWQTRITGTGSSEIGVAVVVDGAGNVVAAGRINGDYFFGADGGDFTVVKIHRGTGAELWRQVIKGTANNLDIARAIAVDDVGDADGVSDVVAAGHTTNTGSGSDFTVVKFDGPSGAELWRQVINGSADNSRDEALAVATDGAGDVVVGGFTSNAGTGANFTVIKFDGASGTELWRQVIPSYSAVRAVAVDKMGNVIAVTGNGFGFGGPALIKLDGASGAELWRQEISGAALLAVTLDGNGNAVVAGNVSGAFTVLKFEGASGAELWRHGIHGTSNSSDERPNAVAVDGGGNVVAAGAIWNTGTALDFTVIKLDGATGAELWRQVIDGASSGNDWANQVTVDGAGNAVAVGQTNNTVPNWSQDRADFTVIKFDGASGTELWRQVIDGAGNGDDFALAVAVDAAGDVVSVGATKNNSAGDDDFIVVKLNGADGGDFVGSGEPAPGPAVENVVWTSIVNATATGNSLQKTSGCDGCDDAGAISLQKITSGGGYIEFMVSETGTLRYVGLSNGSFSTGATEIDFAIAIGWGWAEVRENGAFRANTTAVAGDLFRILAEAGMVKYYKNGALVYLSAVAPAYPLVLDTSLFNVGAAVNNAVIAGTLDSGGGSGSDTTAPVISNVASSSVSSNGATITWTTNEPSDSQVEYGTTTAYGNSTPLDPSLVTSHTQTLSALASNTVYHYRVRSSDAAGNLAVSGDFTFATTGSGTGTTVENVIWTDIVNATATGNSLTKTSGCDGCDDAGAVSQQQITGDGYVEFTVTETDLLRYVGLSNGSSGTGYSEIDYAFAVGFGWVEVRENGAYRANAGIAAGDVLRIAVESGVVNYYINGSLLYTSAVTPVFPLVMDATLFHLNATVSNALIAY